MDRIARTPQHLWGILRAAGLLPALLGLALPAVGQPSGALQSPLAAESVPSGGVETSAAAPSGRDASLFASPTTHDHIGRVVVPVMVNGLGPFRFIVDTGANHSTISPGLVRTLGLKPTAVPSIMLDGITGSARVSFVTINRLEAGALTIDDTALPVVWAPVMAGADGILGAAGLSEKTLLIDFQRNRVVISRAVEAGVRAESMRIHALRLTYGLMTLETRVAGVRVLAVIDTGSERTLGNLALRNALKVRRSPGVIVQLTSVYGATKQVEPGEIQRSPPITIESLRITGVAIVYGDFHIFKVWELQDKPAMIIGMDVLGTVASLGFDFKNQDIYVAGARESRDMHSAIHEISADRTQR